MAFVTLCPQCQTGFAVQPEHLSAADGWVRCGRCAHVFAVDKHLFEMEDLRPVQELVQPLSKPLHASKPTQKSLSPAVPTSLFLPGLLMVLLLTQWLVFQRHMLAARMPEAAPALHWTCQLLDCQVQSWMDPDQVSIESSSFKRLAPERFVFEGVVRNLGDAQLAAPALELSLTRSGDVVVRKVISAEQLLFPETLKARRNQNFVLNFSLDSSVANGIDGYTALLFYP